MGIHVGDLSPQGMGMGKMFPASVRGIPAVKFFRRGTPTGKSPLPSLVGIMRGTNNKTCFLFLFYYIFWLKDLIIE
jgi:hypothetical protein